jgi:hypothetical protein
VGAIACVVCCWSALRFRNYDVLTSVPSICDL